MYVSSDGENFRFVFNKLDKVKQCMDEEISSVNNYSMLTKVPDFYLQSNTIANTEASASEANTREL